jgi:putative transposase
VIISFKYRVKDASVRRHLARQARACNQVWNFCVATQREAQRRWTAGCPGHWPSAYDLMKLTAGTSTTLGLHSDVINEVCKQFDRSRRAKRGAPGFRSSFGRGRKLGWIPLKHRAIQLRDGYVVMRGRKYHYWDSRPLGGKVKTGCFVEDARGRWYLVLQCEVEEAAQKPGKAIGIDLGLKTLATLSDGRKIENPRHFAKYEAALAVAQRAGNKRRVRAIHAKITNARRDFLHKQSTDLVRQYGHIVVGNVSSSKLKKTRMAKSVSDAGWSSFRLMLSYKCQKAGALFTEANERFTSQVCSACGSISAGSPKGMSALGIRQWDCTDCGASHDRDCNAAANILRVGLSRQPPSVGMAA